MFSATRIRGALDVESLDKVFAEIVKRHESLRTTFLERREGGVVQVVHASIPHRVERRDLRNVPADYRSRVLLDFLRRESLTLFDLRKGPLFRAKLVAVDENEHVLVVSAHRLIADAASLDRIGQEAEALYGAFRNGKSSLLPPVSVGFTDVLRTLEEGDREAEVARQLAYWEEQLPDVPSPAPSPRRTAYVHADVPPATTERLVEHARSSGTTIESVLLAATAAVLARLSGRDDVYVTMPLSTRREEAEHVVGPFENTVLLHLSVPGDLPIRALLKQASDAVAGATAHRDVPFDRLVRELSSHQGGAVSIGHAHLDVASTRPSPFSFEGCECERLIEPISPTPFELTLRAFRGDGIRLELTYDLDTRDASKTDRLVRRVAAFLADMTTNPEATVRDVSIDLPGEREKLPDPTAGIEVRPQPSIPALFAAQAQKTPNAVAVIDDAHEWTYAELETRANRVAHWLVGEGVRPGDVVAVVANRNAHTVWAILAILKAGAAFVILDDELPVLRLAEQVRASSPAAWLDTAESPSKLAALEAVVGPAQKKLRLVGGEEAWSALPATSPADVGPDARAYVAFTSGTTGAPRGIIGAHGPLSHFVEWHAKAHGLHAGDRFSALSGLAHDPFLRDVLTPLAIGASVCVPPEEVRFDPSELEAWLRRTRVTVCHLTPSLGSALALARGGELPDLRFLFFAGETLRGEVVESVRRIAPNARCVNFYGATETPQAMASHAVPEGATGTIPVGVGIDGVQLLVVSGRSRVAAVDEVGEVCVRTPYLAVGYLDGQARGFAKNPFRADDSDRVYFTGDRGSYQPDGSVVVAGRFDDQVKIRGFRVEPDEIAAALRASPLVQACVVTPFRSGDDDALCAYVVLDGQAAAAASEGTLRTWLSERLPPAMVPHAFVFLERMPLTANGKVDRRALPPPEQSLPKKADGDRPENEVEEAIAQVFIDILGLDAVGRHDNFFDLGGHSLNAMQVAAQIGDRFDIDMSVRTIFDAPTIAELAPKVIDAVLRPVRQG